MFDMQIKKSEVQEAITVLINKLDQPVQLMESIGTVLTSTTAQNFLSQGRPRWLGLKNPGPKRKNGMILQDTGRLRDSIVMESTGNSVTIGTNVVYAPIHQLGGHTKAHVIKPKNKQALAFNGKFAKKVNHPGSKISARPFLPITENGELQPEALPGIESVVQIYLKSLTGG